MAAVVHLSPYHFARQLRAALNERSTSCGQLARSAWWMSRSAPASRTKASFPFTSSGWSASRRDSFGFPQESRKSPQALARTRTPSPVSLLLKHDEDQPRAALKKPELKKEFVSLMRNCFWRNSVSDWLAVVGLLSSKAILRSSDVWTLRRSGSRKKI